MARSARRAAALGFPLRRDPDTVGVGLSLLDRGLPICDGGRQPQYDGCPLAGPCINIHRRPMERGEAFCRPELAGPQRSIRMRTVVRNGDLHAAAHMPGPKQHTAAGRLFDGLAQNVA